MTKPKKSERPKVTLLVYQPKQEKPFVEIAWTDQGKERISARITKALRAEGYDTLAVRDSRYAPEGCRYCGIQTTAPLDVVQRVVEQYFLVVQVEHRELHEEGTAANLLDL